MLESDAQRSGLDHPLDHPLGAHIDTEPTVFGTLSSPPPDTTIWSAARARAYDSAIEQEAAPDAVLHLSHARAEVPIFEGVTELNLNRGAAWIEGTSALGGDGNIGIAGHRDGFFRVLQDIRIGDRLFIETLRRVYEYEVVATDIVASDAVEVLERTAQPSLTLVTCYPFYYVGPAPQRFIVRAHRSAQTQLSSIAGARGVSRRRQ